MSIVQSNK